MKKQYIECGRILGAHGVRGLFKTEVWCDSAKVLAAQKRVFLEGSVGNYEERRVTSATVAQNIVILGIEGIDSREDAIAMKNTVLYLHRDDIPLKKGDFLIADMIGLPVIHVDTERVLGTVREVSDVPTGLLVTITDTDGDTVLMPYVKEFFKEIDTERGVFVRPIPGFFKDDAI